MANNPEMPRHRAPGTTSEAAVWGECEKSGRRTDQNIMVKAITVEYIRKTGYSLEAAPLEDWRNYDESDPVPGYFEFDWLSAYHPDLYHKFSLSTEGLMDELEKIVDLSDLVVVDIGAGTGRATIRASEKAEHVYAIDAYRSVAEFGRDLVLQLDLRNVDYVQANGADIPLPDNSVDVCLHSWAILDHKEAYRVLKPHGLLVSLGPAAGSLCGELTATLALEYPDLIKSVASFESFDPHCPPAKSEVEAWADIPLVAPASVRDFTYVAEYGDAKEAAVILGRLYGPGAKSYIRDRDQSTLGWRLRITVARVAK